MAFASPLSPTFNGHIASTLDALLLFEACLSGALNYVARRPHDRERVSLIQSGNVFIYEEHSSSIKRWTDGVPWSPSRILGNFLVYRELERPFPPGEKKRAMKRSKTSHGISKAPEPYGGLSNGMSNGYNTASAAASTFDSVNSNSFSNETERSLIGSLVDSYGFKEGGLVKKTVSVTVRGVSYHLVSYYTIADVMNNKFSTPTKDPRFQNVTPRPYLITKQNFRTPIDGIGNLNRINDGSANTAYLYARNGNGITNQDTSHHLTTLPTPLIAYSQTSSLFNYPMTPNYVYSDGTNSSYGAHFARAPSIYPASKTESYDMEGYRQYYNSVIAITSDSSRSQMPSVNTILSHRTSNIEKGGLVDCDISRSAGSNDSKFTNDSGYHPRVSTIALEITPTPPEITKPQHI
jgi:hypothetical protein